MEKQTIRLNGSSLIGDMELGERFRVINDSLWISLFSLVGEPDGIRAEAGEHASKYLELDLGKGYEKLLEDNPADYLVVDLCYTVFRKLCRWKGQIFTMNPVFMKSKFYEEHMDELEEIDVANDEFDWKPYMDRYLELIHPYFDSDHIILVRSRCPLWYVTHTHVRRLRRKGRKAYNLRMKEFEEYFIAKTNPYIVDIYSHYYLDYNHKRGMSMTSFERPFYLHARRLISQIIRTKPEQRVFGGQEFFIRFGRFLKYYDNLFAKKNTGLMMDDSRFIDRLILSLGRELLCEYESDIVAIEAAGHESIDEILANYNFKFAESLKTCLEVVKAVWEGDIFREGVDYGAIFAYKLKLVDPFTELVRAEVLRRGVISDKLYINRYNVEKYYGLMTRGSGLRDAALRKWALSLGQDEEERGRIRRELMSQRAAGAGMYEACFRAMNLYYRPVQVDLWGSCITREILNEDRGRFAIGHYAYRNCILFAFDEPVPSENVDFSDLTLFGSREWQMDYVRSAFRKDLPSRLAETGSEWLLLDFYDLICDVVQYRGGYITADKEVRALKFYKQIKDECTLTSVEEVLDDESIRQRFDAFIRFIRERYGKKVVLIRADVKVKFLTYRRELKPLKGYKRETLLQKKAFLKKWQDYFEEKMDGYYLIDYADKYRADDLCVSGAFMVHYEKEFYEKGYRALYEIVYKGRGETWWKK